MEEIQVMPKNISNENDININIDTKGKVETDESEFPFRDSLKKLSKIEKTGLSNNSNSISMVHVNSYFRRENSIRSLKNYYLLNEFSQTKLTTNDSDTAKYSSDAISIRSWASVGMGSTDGRKMIVRRVPTSTVELFNIVNPPT